MVKQILCTGVIEMYSFKNSSGSKKKKKKKKKINCTDANLYDMSRIPYVVGATTEIAYFWVAMPVILVQINT